MSKWLVVVALCLSVAACGGVDPDSPLGKRQTAFKSMLKVSEELGGMLRGRVPYDEARFIAGAAELQQLSREPWQYFPEVRDDERSQATDEVWKRQAQFREIADELQKETADLLAATATPPLSRSHLKPLLQRIEDSCERCHQAFRAY